MSRKAFIAGVEQLHTSIFNLLIISVSLRDIYIRTTWSINYNWFWSISILFGLEGTINCYLSK